MSWASVFAIISFPTSVAAGTTAVSGTMGTATTAGTGDQGTIVAAIKAMYDGSSTMAALLNAAVSNGRAIRIATTTEPGSTDHNPPDQIALDLTPENWFINDTGDLVESGLLINIAHELKHLLSTAPDPANAYGIGQANFDYKGSAVDFQNSVASEMGWANKIQSSYHAQTIYGNGQDVQLQRAQSYTDGGHVDIAIIDADGYSDSIDVSANTTGGTMLLLGLDGGDTLTTSSGNDWIYGGEGNDVLNGGAGNDHLLGENDSDSLSGGAGNDTLEGGAGNDTLDGGEDADSVNGGAGADVIIAGSNDTISGGDGLDTLSSSVATVSLDGGDGADSITSSGDSNTIQGGAGDDYIEASAPYADVSGGAGDDYLDLRDQTFDDTYANVEELGVVHFGIGSGNDRIADTRIGDGDLYWSWRGIKKIVFDGLATTDVELLYYPVVFVPVGNSQSYYDGIAAFRIKSTGEILYIGDTTTGGNWDFTPFNDNTLGWDFDFSFTDREWGYAWDLGIVRADFSSVGAGALGPAAESLSGSAGSDSLTGNDGTDTIAAGDGADTISAGRGGDNISAGDGNDVIYFGIALSGPVALDGGPGTDVVEATASNVVMNFSSFGGIEEFSAGGYSNVGIIGSSADNTFDFSGITLSGISYLSGGDGNDTLTGSTGDDTLLGGAGNDVLDGESGQNTISYATAVAGVAVDLGQSAPQDTGGDGVDTLLNFEGLTGSSFGDTLTGSSGNNTLSGASGSDTLEGGAGNDILNGGSERDAASYASASAAVSVSISITSAQATGGAGVDQLVSIEDLFGSAYADTLTGNSLANALSGGAGADSLDGGAGNDTLNGDDGDDVLVSGGGSDVLNGGNGLDTVSIVGSTGVSINLGSGGAQGVGGGSTVTLSSIENVIGSAGTDTLVGDTGANSLTGGSGDDSLAGSDGDDQFRYSGSSNGFDAVDGGAGNDEIRALANSGVIGLTSLTGVETITAGAFMSVSIAGSSGANNIDLSSVTVSGITLIDMGSGDDTLTGSSGADTIRGSGGNDNLAGGGDADSFQYTGSSNGFDTIDGGSGSDEVRALANNTVIGLAAISGVEAVTAGAFTGVSIAGSTNADLLDFSSVTLSGISSINAGSGSDTIVGSAAADTLIGGTGADNLAGGSGSDVFRYLATSESTSASRDVITDFVHGTDIINLASIDAKTTVAGDQAFSFIGTSAFSNTAGQLRYDASDPAKITIYGDVNGDSSADIVIEITGNSVFSASDFVL